MEVYESRAPEEKVDLRSSITLGVDDIVLRECKMRRKREVCKPGDTGM